MIMIHLFMYLMAASNFLFLLSTLYYYRKFKEVRKKDSYDLREFLKHLMAGNALLQIKVIDPGDLLLRTRRQ